MDRAQSQSPIPAPISPKEQRETARAHPLEREPVNPGHKDPQYDYGDPDFDGQKYCAHICNLYPRSTYDRATDELIFKAVESEAEHQKVSMRDAATYLQRRIERISELVAAWPDKSRIPCLKKVLQERTYRQDDALWQPSKPANGNAGTEPARPPTSRSRPLSEQIAEMHTKCDAREALVPGGKG